MKPPRPEVVSAAVARTACTAAAAIMAYVTFGAAPALFQVYPRAVAGEITGVLFPSYYQVLYGLGGVALIALAAGRRGIRRAGPALALTGLAVALVATMDHGLGPVLDRLRADRAAFARWHGVAMLANLGALLAFGVASLVWKAQDSGHGNAGASASSVPTTPETSNPNPKHCG